MPFLLPNSPKWCWRIPYSTYLSDTTGPIYPKVRALWESTFLGQIHRICLDKHKSSDILPLVKITIWRPFKSLNIKTQVAVVDVHSAIPVGRSTSPIKHSHKIGKALFLDTSILHNCWLCNIPFYAYKISFNPRQFSICDAHLWCPSNPHRIFCFIIIY